jgi:hypothetical protein
MARLTKNCSYGHRDLLSSFPKRPYFLSSGEWTLRNNFSRASWFIRVLSAHSRTRVWGRDLPVTPVILRNKGFPCITSMIIPSPSSHCILGRCRLPGHEIEPARVSPGLLRIHPVWPAKGLYFHCTLARNAVNSAPLPFPRNFGGSNCQGRFAAPLPGSGRERKSG